jgi:glycine cleavage system H protein
MEFPPELRYSQDHLWVRDEDDGEVVVGITDYAQEQLGKVVYVDLPEEGEEVSVGDEMGAIESAKSVSDLICPVSGEVIEINDSLADAPAVINDDPYGDGWLIRVKLDNGLPGDLVSADEYEEQISQ